MSSVRGDRPAAAVPRRTITTRILLSFAVTLLAFAVTVGFSVVVQQRTARENDELTKGYLPVALKLGQLRAAQAALTSLVEGIADDDKNPTATRQVVGTMARVRSVTFEEARRAVVDDLRARGGEGSRDTALELAGELDGIGALWREDGAAFERVFAAIDAGDHDAVNSEIVALGPREHEALARLSQLSERVMRSLDALSAAARKRQQLTLLSLVTLSAVTLAIAVAVALRTRRLLEPLARITERAGAVAAGDLTAEPALDRDDELGALSSTFEHMVAAVARAQSRAVESERLAAIGKMAAHVTHEIRNPLSSIGLNIELLEEELSRDSPEARALLAAIAREVQRLEHLSEEYLRLARLPSPRMEAEDVAGAVEDAVAFCRPELERAGCTLTLTVGEGLLPVVFDEAQIRQALMNLLRNAREAMPKGGAVHVSVVAEGMSVDVLVEDEGPGIAEEIRERVFDPFVSTKGEGTGLGLAISRQIMEAHGGDLTCEARAERGTRFRLRLPIASPRSSRVHQARAAGEADDEGDA